MSQVARQTLKARGNDSTQISHLMLLQSQVTPDSSANTHYYSPGNRGSFPVELIASIYVHHNKETVITKLLLYWTSEDTFDKIHAP